VTNSSLYRKHLAQLDQCLSDAIARAARAQVAVDGIVIYAGRNGFHYADDNAMSFRATPHLLRYVPLNGCDHLVVAAPGRQPIVIRVVPRDFWEEVAPLPASYWQSEVDLREVATIEDAIDSLQLRGRYAFVGPAGPASARLGISQELIEPPALMRPLDWHRAIKTEHEVALLEAACARGADGHRVARKAFESGASEREIHWAYLQATDHLERELPFETIVAFNEKSAILHYHHKRGREMAPGRSLIMDAGAQVDEYFSDITRTWYQPDVDPVFVSLIHGVDALQRELVEMVAPGRSYVELHVAAHQRVATLLCETGIATCRPDRAFEAGLARSFMPHGLGHHVGVQVHDVGGRQTTPEGEITPPPADAPMLRTTRPLAAGHFVTIEPGLYFIPMLLERLRASEHRALLDWKLVDRLTPFGGIRIEDNVLCTETGARDLTRPLLSGPRGV
jgi:Xaa-Pro dipeptidase